jgi:Cu/Ag efflux pump CusA
VNRAQAARYGLIVGDVQRAITSGNRRQEYRGNIEGRERHSISVLWVPKLHSR